MKKLLVLIITSLGIFSIFSYANAREGSLERALDLEYGPEAFELALPEIWNYYLKNTKNKNALKTFKTDDSILKEAFMRDYRDGKFDYTKTNAIIENYNLFVYHTNKYFEYLSLKEKDPTNSEADTAILRNYKSSRAYIKKLKHLISLDE